MEMNGTLRDVSTAGERVAFIVVAEVEEEAVPFWTVLPSDRETTSQAISTVLFEVLVLSARVNVSVVELVSSPLTWYRDSIPATPVPPRRDMTRNDLLVSTALMLAVAEADPALMVVSPRWTDAPCIWTTCQATVTAIPASFRLSSRFVEEVS